MEVLKLFLKPWTIAGLLFLVSLGYLWQLMRCVNDCVAEARLFLGTLLAAVGVLVLLYEVHHHLKPLYFIGILLAYVLLAAAIVVLLAPELASAFL